MSDDQQPVSILFFKGPHCAPCKVVEKHLMNIVKSSGAGTVKFTSIDTDQETELVDHYSVTNVPEVYFNETKVLSAQQASEMLAVGGLEQSLMGIEEESSHPMNIFSQGQNTLFNYLFNHLIRESIRSDEVRRQDWNKYSTIILSEQDLKDTQELLRVSIGDYIHVGALQSIILAILSLGPDSGKYLYNAGKGLGTIGTPQIRFIRANPKILGMSDLDDKSRLKRVMNALEKHFNAKAYGLPLYITNRAKVDVLSTTKAKIRIFDSAYAAGITNINIPVCYLIAGEIAGLLETTLGHYVKVEEKKCVGMGNQYCEFSIKILDSPAEKVKDDEIGASAIFSEERKAKFQEAMEHTSKNMYNSALLRSKIRDCGDYVHMSVFQHALTSIKFADPFYGTLLYYSGVFQGKNGPDYAVVERLAERESIALPAGFKDGCRLLEAYFNDPSTILSRRTGNIGIKILDDESAEIKVYECATATKLVLQSAESRVSIPLAKEEKDKIYLCDYMTGFITGRLERILDWEIKVKEIDCHSQGSKYCKFKVDLD